MIETNNSILFKNSKLTNFSNLGEMYDINEDDVIMSYSGPFDTDILKVYGEKLKTLTKLHPQAGRKLFFTFIELAQNVSFYSNEKSKISDKKTAGAGTVIIGESKDKYFFVSGNVIFFNSVDTLQRKIKIINSLDREELRKYKREQRNLIPGSNGNAHIGLIMTALSTKRDINANVLKIDNKNYYFSIFVEIDKK